MSDERGTWLDTDYETEGTLALEMTVEQLRKVTNEPYRWKWVIISLHNATQAFLVKACSGSDLLGAMTRKYRDHWYAQYEKGEKPTQPERLATVQELVRRATHLTGFVHSKPLEPSSDQRQAIASLGTWRDTFIHFKPGSLSIEISGFPWLAGNSLDVIDFLAFESGHVFMGASEQADRTRAATDTARSLIRGLAEGYESRSAAPTDPQNESVGTGLPESGLD